VKGKGEMKMKTTRFAPEDVRAARKHVRMTQEQAAKLIGASRRAWLFWEKTGINAKSISCSAFELFCIKTGQEERFRALNADCASVRAP
jgi:DNA-binding XRE family transcriptional regulator